MVRYGILDTPGEEAFDGIVRLATKLCGTPVGMITLVTSKRQWFKARVGLEEMETPLDRSICVHALPEPTLFVIPDLTRDARTMANPAVTGPSAMRFYAAAPLRTASGHGLGTLCVIDREPRETGLTLSQAEILTALGDQVMSLFEARRAALAEKETALRLRSSEALIQGVLTASPDCIMVLDLDGNLVFMNEPGMNLMGIDDFAAIAGSPWHRSWTGADGAKARQAVSTARAGTPARFEGWADTKRGVSKYWHVMVTPIAGSDGRPDRLLAVSRDQTEARRDAARQVELTTLGERLLGIADPSEVGARVAEMAGRALDLSRAAYGTIDPSGRIIAFERDWTRPGQRSVAGRHPFMCYGAYADDLRRGEAVVIPDVRTDPRTASKATELGLHGIASLLDVPAMMEGRLVGVLCLHDADPRDWTDRDIVFARAAAERGRAELARIAAEEQQQLRTREVGHRFKNLLAMVQAIATQTMRSTDDVKVASDILAGRLAALGQSHDLLLDGGMGSGPILDVVRRALDMHLDAAERFDISGPEVRIGAKVALSLSLMLHELATNAVKYGALSNLSGRVTLGWQVRGTVGEPRLRLTWIEEGGPPVVPPTRKGFGSRLIERGLAGQVGGVVELSYPSTGFAFLIEAPLAAFQVEI
ncbi:GAF domain-containing protein [Methylobacterium sp. WL103]|uniref:GAF domain-containing protein n=1 Tax=Methylobacterium sp. WL103 TaxID=2603891 RepID=UPI001FEDB1E5|nr:GAF domain-containing protein [Methylobacterium sp. WL103]